MALATQNTDIRVSEHYIIVYPHCPLHLLLLTLPLSLFCPQMSADCPPVLTGRCPGSPTAPPAACPSAQSARAPRLPCCLPAEVTGGGGSSTRTGMQSLRARPLVRTRAVVASIAGELNGDVEAAVSGN